VIIFLSRQGSPAVFFLFCALSGSRLPEVRISAVSLLFSQMTFARSCHLLFLPSRPSLCPVPESPSTDTFPPDMTFLFFLLRFDRSRVLEGQQTITPPCWGVHQVMPELLLSSIFSLDHIETPSAYPLFPTQDCRRSSRDESSFL